MHFYCKNIWKCKHSITTIASGLITFFFSMWSQMYQGQGITWGPMTANTETVFCPWKEAVSLFVAIQSMVHEPAASSLLGERVILGVKISDPTPDFQSQNVRLARSSTNAHAHERLSCAIVQTPSNSKFRRTKRWVSSLGYATGQEVPYSLEASLPPL